VPCADPGGSLDRLDFAALIKPGDLIVCGQGPAEPTALTGRLMQQRAALGGVRAFIGFSWSQTPDPEYTDHVSFSSYCGSANNRRLGDRLEILPVHYSMLAGALGAQAPVLLLQLAAGDDAHSFSFGAAQEYLTDLLPRARLVIAEVNAQAPRTRGARIARAAIDVLVPTDYAPAHLPPPVFGAVERSIAERVAALIEDGATLQFGLGAIPGAVAAALLQHRRLGIHSGLIGDDVLALAQSGALTNECKTLDHGVTVTGMLAGGPALLQWSHDNAGLALRPTSYTHAHENLAGQHRFCAVNSAIEVDLSGQINTEVAAGRYLGAVGGAIDFLRGAAASRGGLPIVALPSTAGGTSRIVAKLSGPVSTSRADAALIVTEHGVADLRGLSIRRRRDHLIAIAAPAYRERLDRSDLSEYLGKG
jgi:acyl-CoA hydrolase